MLKFHQTSYKHGIKTECASTRCGNQYAWTELNALAQQVFDIEVPFVKDNSVFWCTPCTHDSQGGGAGLVTLVYKLASEQCFVECWKYLKEKKLPLIFDLDHTLIHAKSLHQTRVRGQKNQTKKGLQQTWTDEVNDIERRINADGLLPGQKNDYKQQKEQLKEQLKDIRPTCQDGERMAKTGGETALDWVAWGRKQAVMMCFRPGLYEFLCEIERYVHNPKTSAPNMCCFRDFECSIGSNGAEDYVQEVAREITLYVSTLKQQKQWHSTYDWQLQGDKKSFFYKVKSLLKYNEKSIDRVIDAPPDMVLIVEDTWARKDKGRVWNKDQCDNILPVSRFDFLQGGAQDLFLPEILLPELQTAHADYYEAAYAFFDKLHTEPWFGLPKQRQTGWTASIYDDSVLIFERPRVRDCARDAGQAAKLDMCSPSPVASRSPSPERCISTGKGQGKALRFGQDSMFMLVIDTMALYAMLDWQNEHTETPWGLLRAILVGGARIVLPQIMIIEMDRHNHNKHERAKAARRTWISDNSMLRQANRDSEFRSKMSFNSKSKLTELQFVERQPVESDKRILQENPEAENDKRCALYALELVNNFGHQRVGVLTNDNTLLDMCYDLGVPRWTMSMPCTLSNGVQQPSFIDLLSSESPKDIFKRLGREQR